MKKTLDAPTRANQFKADAKFDELVLIRIAYCFCQGVSTPAAAVSAGLSVKTVRGAYLALRHRLLKPIFNRWHGSNRALLSLTDPEDELMVRAAYFNLLARCAENETCARNYRLGNRKARQCRTCPLATVRSDQRRAEAHAVIDMVHAFYERIGIRGEKTMPAVPLFRERLIHATTVATVQSQSKRLPNGLFDPTERAFLCGGTLLDALLTDLTGEPL